MFWIHSTSLRTGFVSDLDIRISYLGNTPQVVGVNDLDCRGLFKRHRNEIIWGFMLRRLGGNRFFFKLV